MTQWVENPTGGRARGPVALARAWGEAIVRPQRLFRTAVAPGDQAPGLVFAATVLVAPAALHLVAALQTVILLAFVDDRAGISETVQVIAYAGAPCVFAGIPVPEIRLLVAAYGSVLLAVGLAEVHHVSLARAGVLAAVPAALVFGYGFRGFAALSAVTGI